MFGCSFSLSRECFLNKPLYCENKWLLIPDFNLPVSRLRGFLSFKFTITHYLVPSVIFFFLPLLWQQSEPCLEAKQLRRLCHRYVCRVPQLLWKCAKFLMRLSLLSPTSTTSPVSRTCWLAIAVGQSSHCLRCAPCASVCRETVTALSLLTLTHLEKYVKKIRLKGFTASSGTFLHSWSLHRKKEIRIYFPKELRWCNKSCKRRKTQDLPNIRMKTVMHIVSMVMEIDKK